MDGWADEKKEPSLPDFMMEFYYSENRNTSYYPSAHPPQSPKERGDVVMDDTSTSQINTIHPSLESYIHARYIQEFYPDEDSQRISRDKQYLNKVTRQLESLFETLGIDKSAFQNPESGNYLITTEVRSLFAFMLDNLLEKAKKTQRVSKNISKDNLLILRELLYDALESCKLEPDTIKYQLKNYEKKTGCPSKYFYYKHGMLVEDTIDYMSADDEISLSDAEWENFADILEYEFRYIWRPQFIDASYRKLESFLSNINKPHSFQDDMSKYFGRTKSPLRPDVWEMRQKRLLKVYLDKIGRNDLFPEIWSMILEGTMLMRISEQDIPPSTSATGEGDPI